MGHAVHSVQHSVNLGSGATITSTHFFALSHNGKKSNSAFHPFGIGKLINDLFGWG